MVRKMRPCMSSVNTESETESTHPLVVSDVFRSVVISITLFHSVVALQGGPGRHLRARCGPSTKWSEEEMS